MASPLRGSRLSRHLLSGACGIALACSVLVGGTAAHAQTPSLPDLRGYELVSPLDNADGDVYEPTLPGLNADNGNGYNTELPFQAAASGDAVAYPGDPSALGGTDHEGKGAGNEYLAVRRPAGGWASTNVEPPSPLASETSAYSAFSADLSTGVLDWNGTLYARSEASMQPLFDASSGARAPGELQAGFAGGSSDFTHLLFAANDTLTPEALDGGPTEDNLYEWVTGPSGATLRSVNVLPGGEAAPDAAFGSPPLAPTEAAQLSHVISAEGSVIFWTDIADGGLYARIAGQRTVEVDAAVGAGGRYQGASADGSSVFFTKAGDLYAYELATAGTTELLAAGELPYGGEVERVLAESEDGSLLYLAGGAELYLLRRGEGLHAIAPLSQGDPPAQATPDGEHLVFADGTGLELYDASSETLTCVACGHTAILQPSHRPTYEPRWISDDGSRVFFDSPEALVPQDTNGRLDVYEWSDGEAHLLSGGTSTDNSFFVDASASGEDVFLVSRAKLVPEDLNEDLDLYDARVGAPAPAPTSPSCSGSDCQGVPPAALALSVPASETFEGEGDLEATAGESPSAQSTQPSKSGVKGVKGAKTRHKARRRHARAPRRRHRQRPHLSRGPHNPRRGA
jgi:hypothetical protein